MAVTKTKTYAQDLQDQARAHAAGMQTEQWLAWQAQREHAETERASERADRLARITRRKRDGRSTNRHASRSTPRALGTPRKRTAASPHPGARRLFAVGTSDGLSQDRAAAGEQWQWGEHNAPAMLRRPTPQVATFMGWVWLTPRRSGERAQWLTWSTMHPADHDNVTGDTTYGAKRPSVDGAETYGRLDELEDDPERFVDVMEAVWERYDPDGAALAVMHQRQTATAGARCALGNGARAETVARLRDVRRALTTEHDPEQRRRLLLVGWALADLVERRA